MEATLLMNTKQFLACISTRIQAVRPKRHIPPHSLHQVKVWSKSVRNKGHCTREDERVFRLYFAWLSQGVTKKAYLEVSTRALQPVKVWSKSFGNEGHFTREDRRVFRLYFASQSRLATEASYVESPYKYAAPSEGLVEIGW
jgi:hypothetical protein